jgi:hypothetical protein
MKTVLALVALSLTSLTAHADGLVCVGEQTAISVKVYNNTDATAGTRTPAIMIVSSPFVKYPNKTIAKFSSANETLVYNGYGKYEATVDLSVKDSSRGGENIAGTKLSQLSKISLAANFSYSIPVKPGAKISATLSYTKHSGEVLTEKADCTRYLKN